MKIIHYIPGILSLVGALVVIIASLRQPIMFSDLCIRISVTLVIFYIIGLFVKKIFINILEDTENKERDMMSKEEESENIQKPDEQDEFVPFPLNLSNEDKAKALSNMMKEK